MSNRQERKRYKKARIANTERRLELAKVGLRGAGNNWFAVFAELEEMMKEENRK